MFSFPSKLIFTNSSTIQDGSLFSFEQIQLISFEDKDICFQYILEATKATLKFMAILIDCLSFSLTAQPQIIPLSVTLVALIFTIVCQLH